MAWEDMGDFGEAPNTQVSPGSWSSVGEFALSEDPAKLFIGIHEPRRLLHLHFRSEAIARHGFCSNNKLTKRRAEATTLNAIRQSCGNLSTDKQSLSQ